jgi:hypothetical protein
MQLAGLTGVRPSKRARPLDAASQGSQGSDQELSDRLLFGHNVARAPVLHPPADARGKKPANFVTGFDDARGRDTPIQCTIEWSFDSAGELICNKTRSPRICNDYPLPCRFMENCKFLHVRGRQEPPAARKASKKARKGRK